MLAGVVAMIDVPAARFGWRTISTAYREAPKWVTYPLSAYLVGHLHGLIPERVDPLHRVAVRLRPRIEEHRSVCGEF